MHPETRHLVLTWAVLMGLTTALGFAGDVLHASRLGVAFLAVIGVVTLVKARLVLARYLRLELAPGFLSGFTGSLAVTVAVIVLSFAVIHQPLVAKPFAGAPIERPTAKP
ncbi:hypothetical protein [Pinisolibacter sp.]|uniref:hypothetical protein n=1 Tax=Pinisolibacter sp. TaxID=2172024 RepID=UPI002FDC96F8